MQSSKSHPFRKKWGQNFLRDPNIIKKIINVIHLDKEDTILEIGPGDGALTGELVKLSRHVHAVEIDPLLIKRLQGEEYLNLTLYHDDILKWDFSKILGKFKIIGNLPYYITSPILFRLLQLSNWFRLVLMVQKEVAIRITAVPGSKAFGRLAAMCQVYSKPKMEFTVSRNVFQPKPEVNSAVVSFEPMQKETPDFNRFSDFIKQCFAQRRKKLKNNLPELYKAGMLGSAADKRPEELSVEKLLRLFNQIKF